MSFRILKRALAAAGALLAASFAADSAAQSDRGLDARSKAVIDHWTPARINSAIPRDLVIDERGLGYLRRGSNDFVPYGHTIAPQAGKPGGGGGGGAGSDTTPPSVSLGSPAAGATIGASATFTATVTDASGVKTVTFFVQQSGGPAQSFGGGASGSVYSVNLSGFTNGSWSWWVVAKDRAKPANTTTSPSRAFTVDTGGGGGGGTVPNAEWTSGGVVQTAAGRIYFEMPGNAQRTTWGGY